MATFGIFDAKTRFSELIAGVEGGESVVITKHGRPVAKIVPYEEPRDQEKIQRAIDGLLEFRRAHPLRGLVIKDLIEEGRRI
jgi:prevent-host-death family protein